MDNILQKSFQEKLKPQIRQIVIKEIKPKGNIHPFKKGGEGSLRLLIRNILPDAQRADNL